MRNIGFSDGTTLQCRKYPTLSSYFGLTLPIHNWHKSITEDLLDQLGQAIGPLWDFCAPISIIVDL